MKKIALIALMALLAGCNTITVPVDNNFNGTEKVRITSHIPERHHLKQKVLKLGQGGLGNQYYSFSSISFNGEKLKAAGFGISFSKTDTFATENEPVAADSFVLLDSIVTREYRAKIWKMSSGHPAFENYEKEFKSITVCIKRDNLYITAGNDSNFKDSITPQFIAQKLSELEFTVKPKN